MIAPKDRRAIRCDRFVIAAFMVAYIASGLNSGSGYDTARDVAEAYAIRHLQAFPLHGPLLAGALYLGPVWFYLLALPLAVHESWLSAALFAQALGSLQFPLAYAAGRRLLDRRFGLLWCALLALPGWGSFELAGFGHANMVRVCAMLVIYALVRLSSERRPVWLAVAAGALALAIHAHPSTAGYALVVVAVAIFALRDVPRLIAWGAVSLLVAALPLAPLAVEQAIAPAASLEQSRDAIRQMTGVDNLRHIPALLYAILIRGPRVIADAFFDWTPGLAAALQGLIVAIGIAALAGLFATARSHRALVLAGLATTAVVVAVVAWMRPVTTFYMTYAMLPPIAALGALGLHRLCALAGSRAVPASLALIGTMLALHVATVAGIARAIGSGGVVMASVPRLDIKQDDAVPALPEPWLPAYAVDASGRLLCAQTRPVVLHATYAYLENVYFGLDHRLHCGPRDIVLLGADPAAATHLVGLAKPLWAALDAKPAIVVGGIGIAPAKQIASPQSGYRVPDGRVYPPYKTPEGPVRTVRLDVEARGNEALAISMPYHIWMPPPLVTVTENGVARSPLARDAISAVYACGRCAVDAAVKWRIEIESVAPEWMDVVTIAPLR